MRPGRALRLTFLLRKKPEPIRRSEGHPWLDGSMALRLVAPTAELSDEGLIAAIRSGDERAIALLYKRYARYVAGIAYRMLGSEDELDDIVQQVFFETAQLAERVEHVRSWLYRLATRQVSRRLKRR